jgi:hypothetical protein
MNKKNSYRPNPIDTSGVQVPPDIMQLTEYLAQNTHEVWSQNRFTEGWRFGPKRDDTLKETPDLVPYEELTESEQQYDRDTALETLKVIIALGYEIKLKK